MPGSARAFREINVSEAQSERRLPPLGVQSRFAPNSVSARFAAEMIDSPNIARNAFNRKGATGTHRHQLHLPAWRLSGSRWALTGPEARLSPRESEVIGSSVQLGVVWFAVYRASRSASPSRLEVVRLSGRGPFQAGGPDLPTRESEAVGCYCCVADSALYRFR